MPYQSSWVEHWLERYCAPGSHDLRPFRDDVLKCGRCEKEELRAGLTCLICGIPGEVGCRLRRAGAQERLLEGLLCGSCSDEFVERIVIRGWSVAGWRPPPLARRNA